MSNNQQTTKNLTAADIQALIAGLSVEEQNKLFKQSVQISINDNGVIAFKMADWRQPLMAYIHRFHAMLQHTDKILAFIEPRMKDWPEKRDYSKDAKVSKADE